MKELYSYKNAVEKEMNRLVDDAKATYKDMDWSDDVFDKLKELSTAGKMFRSCLMLKNLEYLGVEPTKKHIKIGAAIELYHTSILIHDDYMDQDSKRRGLETFHSYFYRKIGDEHCSNSMAVAVGDLGLFLATKTVDETEISGPITILCKEFISTCLAQLNDMAFALEKEPSKEDILDMYRCKTGRYTFSLPFILSSSLADEEGDDFGRLGEILGILFQIKDDELGLIGDEEETGKSSHSDVEDDKRTLHRLVAYETIDEDTLNQYFGQEQNKQSMNELRSILKEHDVFKELQEEMERYEEEAKTIISNLYLEPNHKEFLHDLTRYVRTRER